MLTTLQRAKDALQISTDDTDVALLMFLDAASNQIESETERIFTAGTYSETFVMAGATGLCLAQFPLTEAPVVTVDGVANTDFTYDAASGVLQKPLGWNGTVVVSYKAGYVLPASENLKATPPVVRNFPFELEMVVIQMVSMAMSRAGSEHLSEETIGPLRYRYLSETPLYMQRIIDKYKKPVIV